MKIAVVGAGISGLASAWLLARDHEVHLFESESRLGGHAHTVNVTETDHTVAMDTGFLVYNELTYPHLVAFFKHLGVTTSASDMSLSVQVPEKNLEWGGTNLNTVFGQRRNLFKPGFLGMLREILRFGREAEANLHSSRRHGTTLGELLTARHYSANFRQDYLLPIGAAIWSTPEQSMLDFPAETFLGFFINHKLLQVNDRPIWRTVQGGSIEYVRKVSAALSHVHLGEAVLQVERRDQSVVVATGNGSQTFDRVVMATHAPITAKILKPASALEEKVLSAFRYEPNHTILHQNASFMPNRPRVWSAWNVYGSHQAGANRKVSLSYYLNRLQNLKSRQNYFVTLNPHRQIDKPLREFEYAHPQFDQTAIRAQNELPLIQGQGGVYFAGAWSRYGFHEDGILSAVKVAGLMGTSVPWATV